MVGTAKTPRRGRSPFQRAAEGVDDAILRRYVEVGMHWQAEHFGGEEIAHRHTALAHRIVLVGLLAMQRDRIINRGRNALGLETGRDLIAAAAGDADGVL